MPNFTSRITGHHSSAIFAVLLFASALLLLGQQPFPDRQDPNQDRKLPDGRSQSEAILKDDYKNNLKDLDEMRTLIGAVEDDLKKNDRHVLSLKALKNLEDVEKLSKRVRSRMKRY